MDIKELILERIKQTGEVKAREIIKQTGFSRAYIGRFFQDLVNEGQILILGKTKGARYVLAGSKFLADIKKEITAFNKSLPNQNLSEDVILADIKKQSGIFFGLAKNVISILDFAFLEILNNAIEHSRSKEISVKFASKPDVLDFWIIDHGVGIFNSLRKKFNLPDDLTAIGHLLKGKQTSDPKHHTGQGIFFTSKMADVFTIISGRKRLRFIKSLDDIFIDDAKLFAGTKVFFSIKKNSKLQARQVFAAYSNEEFEFDKTKILIKLSKNSQGLVSRSEARRIVFGLDKFKEIILDFKDVATAGQGFCDEVFRVWQNQYPTIRVSYINANKNVEFMIKRATKQFL